MADYIFNVARLLREPSGASRSFEVEAPREALDVDELVGAVRGQVRLLRLADSILATGQFLTPVETPCARCLDPVRLNLPFEISDAYVPLLDPLTGAPAPPDAEAYRLDDRHNLDLSLVLGEAVVAALPFVVLCRPDCPGLPGVAPAASRAEPASVDPRWAALHELRQRMASDRSPSRG
ncbi:MAG: DUF177 domain-containing protein [Actinobacteria bacterium]|nr:DUF177 domain-containing protein [Actinomycetota bacterium]